MKLAIVHDYLNQAGGAERVVASLHRLFPDAPIFTTLFDPHVIGEPLASADVRVSWMQRLPAWRRHFRAYLPLYPLAVRSFDLRGYDVVISSSSAWAKGVRVDPGALHLCYCHTPMRWAWNYDNYVARSDLGVVARLVARPVARALRLWDVRTARRVDQFVANSTIVAQRIRTSWGRESVVVPPPVDVARFDPHAPPGNYALVVSRLNGYKRIDLAVRACTARTIPLVVVGDGPDRAALKALAGPSVWFAGQLSDAETAAVYAGCRVFILPGEEDFGITPLEANAAGRPVVAFGQGGVLDTVIDGVTGLLFADATPESLGAALERAFAISWDPEPLRAHAETFSEAVFATRFMEALTTMQTASAVHLAPREQGRVSST